MNVVAFNGESEDETSQDKSNDIVHVRVSDGISRGNPKQREQKQGTHGGHRKRHGGGDPPGENPGDDGEHILGSFGSTIKLNEEADDDGKQRTQDDVKVLEGEDGFEGEGVVVYAARCLMEWEEWGFEVELIGGRCGTVFSCHFGQKMETNVCVSVMFSVQRGNEGKE